MEKNFDPKNCFQILESEAMKNSYTVYKYFKDKLGLVTKGYAKKVLKVGDTRFDRIAKEYDLNPVDIPAPETCWLTRLYDLNKVYEIRNKISEKKTA